MSYNFSDPIISQMRSGGQNDPFVQKNEPQQIVSGKVVLSEIPDILTKVQVTGDNISWQEITSGNPSTGQYIVDYTGRTVTFDSQYNNLTLQFSYKGKGLQFIPIDSIYTQTDSNGNIIQTLGDLATNSQQAINNLTLIGNYDNTHSYVASNLVNYNGTIYICTINSTGNLPTDITHWRPFMGLNTQIAELENEVTVTTTVSSVQIGIAQYNQSNDVLIVHKNSTYLKNGVDYTVSGGSILPVGGNWVGTTSTPLVFDFLVLKNVISTVPSGDGSLIQQGTIGNLQLANDVKVGSLANLTTTAKTDAVSAINENANKINVLSGNIGDKTLLNTTAKDSLVNATNELHDQIGTLSDMNGINIKSVGAVESSTDNTTALLASETKAKAQKCGVFVPSGTFKVADVTVLTSTLYYGLGTIYDNNGKQLSINKGNAKIENSPIHAKTKVYAKDTYGTFDSASVASIIANQGTNPQTQVLGLTSPSQAATYGDRDSVALYTSNTSRNASITTNINTTFTTTSVVLGTTLTGDQWNVLEIGMLIDTTHATKYTGTITGWDQPSNTINVSGWFQQGNTASGQLPANNVAIKINPITKIWAQNVVVDLVSTATDVPNAMGIEIDTLKDVAGGDIGALDLVHMGSQDSGSMLRIRKANSSATYKISRGIELDNNDVGVYASLGNIGFASMNQSQVGFYTESSIEGFKSSGDTNQAAFHAVDKTANAEGMSILNDGRITGLKYSRQVITDAAPTFDFINNVLFYINSATVAKHLTFPLASAHTFRVVKLLNIGTDVYLDLASGTFVLSGGTTSTSLHVLSKRCIEVASDGTNWFLLAPVGDPTV